MRRSRLGTDQLRPCAGILIRKMSIFKTDNIRVFAWQSITEKKDSLVRIPGQFVNDVVFMKKINSY